MSDFINPFQSSSFERWVEDFRLAYPQYDVPWLVGDDWRQWTDQLQNNVPGIIWPDDRQYQDWQYWAAEVMQLIA